MCKQRRKASWPTILSALLSVTILIAFCGCGPYTPEYRRLRYWGQQSIVDQNWGAARSFLDDAQQIVPEDAENLHDLGVCSMILAQKQFSAGNTSAGMREANRAVEYFNRSIHAKPGFRPAILGKNRALELRGQFEEALRTAQWAATYVGPSAEQQIFLAKEYEERGDADSALLRLRQAIAMEPNSPDPYVALAQFSERNGNRAAAIQAYRQAYMLDNSRTDVAQRLRDMGEYVPPPLPTE